MAQGATKRAKKVRREENETTGIEEISLVGFLAKWNTEIIRFYVSRYQRYWTLPLKLLSCTSPDDVKALQLEFQRELFEDYRTEASRLSRIANGTADSAASSESDYAARLLEAQEHARAIIEQAKLQAERIVASAHERAGLSGENAEEVAEKKRA